MSKTTTAPKTEAVSVNVTAAPATPAAEAVTIPEPVATKAAVTKAAATKVVAKKPASAKPAVAPAAKSVAKAAAKPAAKAVKPAAAVDTKKVAKADAVPPAAKAAKEVKAKKVVPKKPKLVRDSFTFPENDYALLAEIKQRALKAGHEIKKSELLRAGLAALAAMPEQELVAALVGVERIKTGRPAK